MLEDLGFWEQMVHDTVVETLKQRGITSRQAIKWCEDYVQRFHFLTLDFTGAAAESVARFLESGSSQI